MLNLVIESRRVQVDVRVISTTQVDSETRTFNVGIVVRDLKIDKTILDTKQRMRLDVAQGVTISFDCTGTGE